MADRPLRTLSGGEQQRAVLARALAQQPRVLLLDEPTAALDLGHAQQVLDLVDRLRRQDGLTVLSTLHDLTLAGQYADRLALLSAGRVAAEGPPAEVLTTAALRTHYGARAEVVQARRAGGPPGARPGLLSGRAGTAPGPPAAAARRGQVGGDHDGQHGVAAGHRVVGEEQHRARRPAAPAPPRAPCPRSAARRRGPAPAAARPAAGPTRLLSAVTVHSCGRQRRPGRRLQPVAPRPGQHPQHRRGRTARAPARRRPPARRPARSPTGSTSPARSGAGPSPESVSVLREPSTGGTSMPPRTAR